MKDFPHPLNTWIDEEITIPGTKSNIDENGHVTIEQTTVKATQRTLYSDSKPTRVICGNHIYNCLNKRKYLFKCQKCDWHRIAPPVTFKFDETTGILTYRKTGIRA